MPTTIATIRARIRQDLHDEDSSAYRWADAVLDRHISQTVRELSLVAPLEATASLTTTGGSREVSIATAAANRVAVEAVEYPTGRYPRSYARFSLWADTLTLLVEGPPAGAEPITLYYTKLHILDANGSTLPAAQEDMVAAGAAAYAALEWASFATNRVNVGGEDTWRHYLAWGQERLAAFHQALAGLSRQRALKPVRLYAPAQPQPSQSTDWGP